MAENAWLCPATLGWFPSTKSGNMAMLRVICLWRKHLTVQGRTHLFGNKKKIVKVEDRIYHQFFKEILGLDFALLHLGVAVQLQASGRDQGRGMETAVTNNASQGHQETVNQMSH